MKGAMDSGLVGKVEKLEKENEEWREAMEEYVNEDEANPDGLRGYLESKTDEIYELHERLEQIQETCIGDGLEYIVEGGEKPEPEPEPEPEKKDTKNVKGNRKVVSTYYSGVSAVFKIPDGLDLEDKSVVEAWGTKYGTLYIKYVGKETEEEIEWEWMPEHDFKYGDDKIEDADNWIDYSDEE